MTVYKPTTVEFYRVERIAGGVLASDKTFIKAIHSILNKKAKTFSMREQRHAYIHAMLKMKNSADKLYLNVMR